MAADWKIEPFHLPDSVSGFSADLPDVAEIHALRETSLAGDEVICSQTGSVGRINRWLHNYRDSLTLEDNTLDIIRDEASGKILAVMISGIVDHENRAWIYSLAVDKEHRKQGMGRVLVQKALECATKEEVDYLELTSTQGAQRFYRKLGFCSISLTDNLFRLSTRENKQAVRVED